MINFHSPCAGSRIVMKTLSSSLMEVEGIITETEESVPNGNVYEFIPKQLLGLLHVDWVCGEVTHGGCKPFYDSNINNQSHVFSAGL